ncbi:sensor histidine kinase [Candidatus Nitrosocosmicus franklandus]|uniref:histidine kinase n=1 Tax=Candidatus Nitrosocosmicus franklandianus TaxID=1798806 RepID=A0A484IAC5_9ARCH|nr:HAMP domain-containing sensor histidine kinase [Candidatus Nitrosocosmicus franklandus]VFJ12975.1 Alkaline phosphatase synthesis sensor protein PhoR [Candidatus Nitrosocosmicus franklandus]
MFNIPTTSESNSKGAIPKIGKNCYLCGKLIESQAETYSDLSEEGIRRFHHKHCYKFFNRLLSVYGDDFSHLELDRVKWGLGYERGDLLELSLFDIKNSKYLKSEVVSDLTSFRRLFLTEFARADTSIDILFSNSLIFRKFGSLLDGAIKPLIESKFFKTEIRILLVKNKAGVGLLEKLHISEIPNIKVNYINDNKNNYFLALFDRSVTFLSEPRLRQDGDNNRKINYKRYLNIVSKKESMSWHAAAAFESLWKQSILESKIKHLSTKMREDVSPNTNYVRILAHELKNPIQPILGFSDMIQNNSRLDPDQKNELLKIISRNARKLDIMTNNILDYARMENKNFRLNHETFDLIKILQELVSDYSIQLNQKKLALNLRYFEKPLYIKADKVRIVEVLDNLIGNAVKFTERGQIDLTVEKLDNYVHMEIRDTGCGIDEKNLNKIFSRFFTTDKLGTGLGLYISKIIITKHGGSIRAMNNKDGVGSVFKIDLPL